MSVLTWRWMVLPWSRPAATWQYLPPRSAPSALVSHRPLILISRDPDVIAAGLRAVDGEQPLVCSADVSNWEAMTDQAKQHQAALAVSGGTLEELADLIEKIKAKGVEDLVLVPTGADLSTSLTLNTQIRRLSIKKISAPWDTRRSLFLRTRPRLLRR